MNPFEMTFRFIETFQGTPSIDGRPPRRPLVLLGDGAPLLEFHKNLGAAMERNGLRPARYFTPHMTLLYGPVPIPAQPIEPIRSDAHTSELQSLLRISYAVFCLKK